MQNTPPLPKCRTMGSYKWNEPHLILTLTFTVGLNHFRTTSKFHNPELFNLPMYDIDFWGCWRSVTLDRPGFNLGLTARRCRRETGPSSTSPSWAYVAWQIRARKTNVRLVSMRVVLCILSIVEELLTMQQLNVQLNRTRCSWWSNDSSRVCSAHLSTGWLGGDNRIKSDDIRIISAMYWTLTSKVDNKHPGCGW